MMNIWVQSSTSSSNAHLHTTDHSQSSRNGRSLCSSQLSRSELSVHTRMATALCGHQSAVSGAKTAKTQRECRRRARDSRRRQAALLFLSNISLDGRPQFPLRDGNNDRRHGEGLRLGEGGAAVPPVPAESRGSASAPSEPVGSGSSSSFPGVLSPAAPGSVRSHGPAAANDVFLEGVSVAEAPLPPADAPLSPPHSGQQFFSRGRSTPALSPLPAAAADPRPR